MIGVVSFFADFTYEGSRSITGPYLAILGASATVVGFVAGIGELLGYGLRLVSGRLSERTGKFWPITLFGYTIQMLSVPLLAFTGSWQLASVLTCVMVARRLSPVAKCRSCSMVSSSMAAAREFGRCPPFESRPGRRL